MRRLRRASPSAPELLPSSTDAGLRCIDDILNEVTQVNKTKSYERS